MTTRGYLKAGQEFIWRGLPGQYDPDARIQIDSLSATMQVNGRIHRRGREPHLLTIGPADLVVAIEQGWLEPVDNASPDGGES